VTENTGNGDDLWGEDVDDDEQTQVAMNPLHRSSVPPPNDLLRSQSRSVSSFGTPKSSRPPAGGEASGRPSLYDRLLQSGALDQGIVTEAKRESSRPLDAGLSRTGSLGLPPPPDLRDLAEALEGDGRDSAEQLRESDIDMVAMTPPPPQVTQTGPRPTMPRPIPSSHVPSMLLGPGASTRDDATERFSHMPSTHPLANSLAPTAPSVRPPPEEKKTPAWMVAIAAVMLIGFGAAIGRFRSQSAEPTVEAPAVVAAARAAEPVATPVPAAPMPAPVAELAPQNEDALPAQDAPAEGSLAAKDPATAASPSPADEPTESPRRRRERGESASTVAAVEPQAIEPTATPASSPAASPAAVAEPSKEIAEPPKAKVVPTGPLAAQPTREQVVAAMDKVLPALTECVGTKHGTANVSMTVRSTGSVSYALVGGTFAGTPEGSCIARVVKQAEFPAFSDPSIRVTYPFQL